MQDLNDLYQEVILDHNRRPRNYGPLPDATHTAKGHNPLCGDKLTLALKIEGDRITGVAFEGSGCAISKASASILTESLKGKTKAEVKSLFDKVHDIVLTGNMDGDVGKLAALAGVHKFPARVKCAILPWHAALAAVEGRGESVSTETARE